MVDLISYSSSVRAIAWMAGLSPRLSGLILKENQGLEKSRLFSQAAPQRPFSFGEKDRMRGVTH